jgi:short-subunit dehydrogenase
MRRTLRDSVVVITGASSGIGQVAAFAFADEGCRLALAARNGAALEQVAVACERRGATAIVVETDVSDAAAVERLAQAASRRLGGRIDVWINNAGVGAVGAFSEVPMESHEQVIRTNLLGTMHGAHAVLPHFRRQGYGVLINTNSLGGWVPAPYAAAYSASKFGMRGFSAALRGELHSWPAIHVCDVFPAFIDTPGLRHAANYSGAEIKPLPPLYDPLDVARAMVSLAKSPRHTTFVGNSALVARVAHFLFPDMLPALMDRANRAYLKRANRMPRSDGNLFCPPADEPGIFGHWRQPKPGAAVKAALPKIAAAAAVAGLALIAFTGRGR